MKRFYKGFLMACGMFTSIPLPFRVWDDGCAGLMMPVFPLVGLLIGGIWYGLALLAHFLGIPLMLQAAVIMLPPYLLTGFLHLDGFMDTNDAILSRRPREEQLRILKDPHTGAFAVVSLGVLFVLAFASSYEAAKTFNYMPMLLLIPVISRSLTGLVLLLCRPLPQSGYAAYFGKNAKPVHKAVLILQWAAAGVAAYLLCGMAGIAAVSSATIGHLWAAGAAYRQLGGWNGDLSGYALTVSEICGLGALAVLSGAL